MILKTAELRAGLGEDLSVFFERFLTNPESENVRNRTGHGMLKLEHCRQDITRRVLLCYLQLAQLTVGTEVSPKR